MNIFLKRFSHNKYRLIIFDLLAVAFVVCVTLG